MTRNLADRVKSNFFLFGLACLSWYALRTGLKPSRASYPCQRAAAFNAKLWVSVYFLPVLAVRGIGERLRNGWKPILVLVVLVSAAGFLSLRDDDVGDDSMTPMNKITVDPLSASAEPASDIYVVTGTNGADGGFQSLIELMAGNGQPFYRSDKKSGNKGPDGLIAVDDVVLVKVNSQWDERGMTNTDLLKAVIEAIVAHPDGFNGEVVVADNGQSQYGAEGAGGSLDWDRNNALDQGQSTQNVVDMFSGHRVSGYLWDTITSNVVSEFAEGDYDDGYVVYTNVTGNGVIVSYPKFTTRYGTRISFKHGVYVAEENEYNVEKLKVINMPVLKTHMIYGVTGAVKHYMGVPSDKLSARLGYRIHNTVDEGGMGTLMAQTRAPTLNLVDAIHVNARPRDGPSTSYASASETGLIAASLDPIAIDYWASKHILCRVCEEVLDGDASTMDPDNLSPGGFGDWLRLSMQELNAAGYGFTCDPDRMNVYVAETG